MAGRGFLKSRLAQLAAEEPQTLQPSVVEDNIKSPVPVINYTKDGSCLQAPRGRRAVLARVAQQSELNQNMTSRLSSLEIRNSNGLLGEFPVSPIRKNEEASKLLAPTTKPHSVSMSLPQQQPINIEKLEEEKSPMICRVSKDSKSDCYQMTKLSSNYIKIEVDENKGLYQYTVKFDPPVDAKATKFYLLNQHREQFPVKTFDGALMYIPTMLPKNVTTLKGTLNDNSEVKITLTFLRKNTLRECVHFYNVLLHSLMKNLGLVQFGRCSFDPNLKMLIPQVKLEIWPGFLTVVDEFENGLYMCCEVSHRVLRNDTVLQTMAEIGAQSSKNHSDAKQELLAVFCGSTVITRYNNKTYRVDDIDFLMSPLSTFEQGGTKISYVDYYKKMYNLEIKDHKQPLIISKVKKLDKKNDPLKETDIVCLIPELCYLTGLTEKMKNDQNLMRTLKIYTTVTPEKRQAAVVEIVNRINTDEVTSQKVKKWGITFCPTPVELEGPIYKRENIILGNKKKTQVRPSMDWGMDVVRNAMFITANLTNWAILFNQKDCSTAKSFCRQLATCTQPMGMHINQPISINVQGAYTESFVSAINSTVRSNPQLQLIVIIFPNKREDRYNAVKRICCAEIGIPSQVIISRTLSSPDRLHSITQKIALQINCKLGGACWAIDIPLKRTMIVGIDTYHEKLKQTSSVVGFVGSMDQTFTKWYSIAEILKNTQQELIGSVQTIFNKALRQFKEENGILPEKIIIYRDGVADGDLKYVEEYEINGVKATFKNYPDYCPMVTYIIVQKRINTRIFQFLNDKYSNPSSGTVLDNTVTRRNYFDFYLVAQHVRQGTVNPSHYIVLENGCNLSISNIQRLSYKLCHLYFNWCGPVKVPAPVQYAHKLAYLIGQNIRQMPNESLCNTLFFL